MVDSSEANKKYAASLGIAASSLTEAQKKQAFFNAVMEAASAIIKKVGSAVDKLTLPEKWQVMTSTIGDLRRELGERLSPAFEFAAVSLTKLVERVLAGVKAKNELRQATKDLAEVTKQSYLVMSQAEIEAAIKTLDMDRTKLAVRIQLLQATKNISLEDMKMLLKLISTHDMLNQKIKALAKELIIGDVVWKDTNDTKKDVQLSLDDLLKKYKGLMDQENSWYEMLKNYQITELGEVAVKESQANAIDELVKKLQAEGTAYQDTAEYGTLVNEMIAKSLELRKNELGVYAGYEKIKKKDMGDMKQESVYRKFMLQAYANELEVIDEIAAAKEKEGASTEQIIPLYTAVIDKYKQAGLTAADFGKAINSINKYTTNFEELVRTKLKNTMQDMSRQMYELPFDMLRDQLKMTAEEGTSFMGRLAIAFVNLGIDVVMTIAKIKLLQGLMLMFPGLGKGGGGLLKGLTAAYGGEVGKMPLKNLPRYARGGPMQGRAGGDVNLGLFKKGEYLIPPERVTPWTRPVLAAIRTGRYKRYASGGEVGGEGVAYGGGDVQVVNVVTEDLLMGVVDKNKRVIVNYITSDLLANGMTRRTIKRTS
jgi:hypothetical protein